MKEIEVKILDVDKEEVIKKLESFGAKKIFDGEIDSHVFDFEDERIQKSFNALRLRKVGDVFELAFKETLSREGAKIEDETEVKVHDFELMYKLLEKIGLKKVKAGKKERISYMFGDVRFEFDTHPGIPTLLEIEAPNIDKLKEMVEKIGFTMEDTKPWSGEDVFKYYNKR